MDTKALQNLRARTDAKIVYAKIHVRLLRDQGGNGGTDFDKAVQESVLFHLLGAKDAFLLELNAYYGCNLANNEVSPGRLRDALKARGLQSLELAEIYELESDAESWLSHAKEMRDHSTHVSGVPRAFHVGGEDDGKVFLLNPKTGAHVPEHAPDALDSWIAGMGELLERLRTTAIAASRSLG